MLRSFITIIILFALPLNCLCQSLSDKERQQLEQTVRGRYESMMMDGSFICKVKGKNILVTIVSVKPNPQMQRIAQVKAARDAGEFLKGAMNKSVTIYESIDRQTNNLNETSEETASSRNAMVDTRISQNDREISQNVTEENFSDKIVQHSLSQVSHMEPLCRLESETNLPTFAYFMILKK